MDKDIYGSSFQTHILEQYKIFVEMADRVSTRRGQANHFYIALLTALIAMLTFVSTKDIFGSVLNIALLTASFIGSLLCVLWWTTIQSYRQLSKLKFAVIHEMEKILPFACYKREREIEKKIKIKYIRPTKVEKYVPFLLMIPYLLLFFYAFYQLVIYKLKKFYCF